MIIKFKLYGVFELKIVIILRGVLEIVYDVLIRSNCFGDRI